MRWSHLGLIACLSAGCAYHGPTEPAYVAPIPSTVPASIRVTASSRSDYTTAVTATVLTSDGNFVAGIPIGFNPANGTASPTVGVTDPKGSATAIVTTPVNTTVTVMISATLSNTIQVIGAAAPTMPPTTPPVVTPPIPTPNPTATINVSSTGTTGALMTFGVGAPALGQTWLWSFGDGKTSQTTAFSTTHTYTAAGVYSASVSAPGINSGNAVITITDPVVR